MAGDALQTIRDLVLIVAGLTVIVSAVVVTYQISRLTKLLTKRIEEISLLTKRIAEEISLLTKRIEEWLDRIDRVRQGVATVTGFVGTAAEVAMRGFTGVPSPRRTTALAIGTVGKVQRILAKVFHRRKR